MTAVELIMVVLFLAGLGLFLAGPFISSDRDSTSKTEYCWGISVVCWMLLTVVFGPVVAKDHYRRGQIDALTGKVKYELVTNEDQTSEWVLIEDAEPGGVR